MNGNDEYNQKQIDKECITGAHVTRLVEFWQDSHFLKTDGRCGPATLKSILKDEMIDSISEADTDPTVRLWEPFHGPLNHLPRTRSDVYRIFGNPGQAKVDKKWVKENIHDFRNLPGVPSRLYVQLHKLAEPYVREALRRAAEVSDYKIERCGGFVFRHQQHNESMPLSYHSWGIAFDINPQDNKGIHYRRGEAPKPFSEEWKQIWPKGMDKAFVDAIKSVGFGSGADWHSFLDPMHFELVL